MHRVTGSIYTETLTHPVRAHFVPADSGLDASERGASRRRASHASGADREAFLRKIFRLRAMIVGGPGVAQPERIST